MAKDTATITDNRSGRQIELPIVKATQGPDAVDISRFFRELGYFTYDPGFLSTASCHSSLTYLDGTQGMLQYRGYPIEQLAEHSSFLEVAHLMLHGELPTHAELDGFSKIITHHSMLNEALKGFFRGFYHDAHPMAIMVGVVGSLSAFYHDSTDITNPRHREIAAHRMIAKMPTRSANRKSTRTIP
jgi:citrate synthase